MSYYTEYMIDIETLAKTPDAVVLSIGAVEFTQDRGVIGQFCSKLDLTQQVNSHRRIDPDTVAWWMSQGDHARREAFSVIGRVRVKESLQALSDFMGESHRAVWAKSPSFDLVILESLYRSAKMDHPWHFQSTRDVRTIVDIADLPHGWEPPSNFNFVPHDPVSDCVWQVEQVRACRQKMAEEKLAL